MAAVHDRDVTDEAGRIRDVMDSSETADEYDAAATVAFAVNVRDDDGLRVVPSTTTMGEWSRVGVTYTGVLKSQPSGAVTVAPAHERGYAIQLRGADD